jgi:hypothetical protein
VFDAADLRFDQGAQAASWHWLARPKLMLVLSMKIFTASPSARLFGIAVFPLLKNRIFVTNHILCPSRAKPSSIKLWIRISMPA